MRSVIGMGWTGSILSRELTKAGLKVVGLERGAMRSPREDFAIPQIRDELKYSSARSCSRTAMETVLAPPRAPRNGAADARLGSFVPGTMSAAPAPTGTARRGAV